VLICKDPTILRVRVGEVTRNKGFFTGANAEELSNVMVKHLKASKAKGLDDKQSLAKRDEALVEGASFVSRTMDTNHQVARNQGGGGGGASGGATAAPPEAPWYAGVMGWICIALVVIFVIWVVFALFRALSGSHGGGGGYGYGGGGGGGGGYGRGSMQDDKPDDGLPKIAAATGGGYFELTSTDNLASTFTRVANELHHQYALGFTPSKLDGKMHKLAIKVTQPGATVRARQSYLATTPRT